jgi:uncharacterized repeat protein (TIGR03803 family)
VIAQCLLRLSSLIVSFFALGFAAEIARAQIDEPHAASIQFTTLHSFDGADGAFPQAGLVQGINGHLYGTTAYGGNNTPAETIGNGTIFDITPSGAFKTVFSFCPEGNCSDGATPVSAGLVQATGGDIFGTTDGGDFGTLFKITPSGTLTTVLHSLCAISNCATGGPTGLVQAANGNFYGTTESDGAYGFGTVFKVTASGELTVLYNFCAQENCPDGYDPYSGLIQATNGDLYGETLTGGTDTNDGGGTGGGTIFKITTSGTLTTLYRFCSRMLNAMCLDGEFPLGGLVQGTNGDFYGTTLSGGAHGGGTIFKITPSGTLTTLYAFCSQIGCPDGEIPRSALVQANDGDFYGTTSTGGGGASAGTIFKITPSGTFTTIYLFCPQAPCGDGGYPDAPLVQDTNGKLYGTAMAGGANGNYGTVFSLSMGLGAFVKTLPTSGNVSAEVKILGTDLTGATGVTFNGVAASFTVASASEISTMVPIGATTGHVRVTTPSGTLSSNVPFRVP